MSTQSSSNVTTILQKEIVGKLAAIEKQVASRSYLASNYLRTSAITILSKEGTGRVYKKPDSKATYRASAPGHVPSGARSGTFAKSWGTHTEVSKTAKNYTVTAGVKSGMMAGGHLLGDLLENGTSRMAARPYKEAVLKGAEGQIKTLFSKPYTI